MLGIEKKNTYNIKKTTEPEHRVRKSNELYEVIGSLYLVLTESSSVLSIMKVHKYSFIDKPSLDFILLTDT